MNENAARPRIRSLPVAEWPEADRLAWEAACCPGERLRRGGAAAHMKPATQRDLARHYRYFLDHLQRHGVCLSDSSAAELVTPERVTTYLAELQGRVGSVTCHTCISKICRMAGLLAPGRDFGWLRAIEADLNLTKVPRSKYPRLVASSAIVEAGLTLFAEAELAAAEAPVLRPCSTNPPRFGLGLKQLRRAVLARNGIMIALLALCPIRLSNFAALTLGSSLCNVGATWWIVLEPAATKSGRADQRPVPKIINPLLDRYVGFYRPLLARAAMPSDVGPLWISSRHGAPMSKGHVEFAIRRTTLTALGMEIGPHMFRTAATTESAARAPHLPGLATALLQHRDQRVTEEHYNRATAHEAAGVYANVLEDLARGRTTLNKAVNS
jgi:integrase